MDELEHIETDKLLHLNMAILKEVEKQSKIFPGMGRWLHSVYSKSSEWDDRTLAVNIKHGAERIQAKMMRGIIFRGMHYHPEFDHVSDPFHKLSEEEQHLDRSSRYDHSPATGNLKLYRKRKVTDFLWLWYRPWKVCITSHVQMKWRCIRHSLYVTYNRHSL